MRHDIIMSFDFTAEWNGLDFRVLLQGRQKDWYRKVIISLAYIESLKCA